MSSITLEMTVGEAVILRMVLQSTMVPSAAQDTVVRIFNKLDTMLKNGPSTDDRGELGR